MSYLVLARKYRPQSFEDLVGQEHVAKTLANAIAQGRVAHAFLFTGVRGVGKTTSARLLAKCLNCAGPDGKATGPTATPCQVCAPCKEIAAGADIDVQEIDGASYNGVDEVRRLQEGLAFRPARDRFKIYIVDEVHMLSNAAWNAFLKTLEEPPPHVKFIFATTEVHKVPVTILSRCQRYDFKLIAAQVIAARLRDVLKMEAITADDASVATLAREAAGSMRDAMSLLDQVIAFSGSTLQGEDVARVLGVADRTILHELASALVDGDAAAALKVVDRLAQQGFDLVHVAKDVLQHLRNLVLAKVCGADGAKLMDLADEETKDVFALAARSDADDFTRLYSGFSRSYDEIARSSQPRMALEMTLVRLARRPPLLPLDELLARLGDLEKRLAGGGAAAAPAGPRGGGAGGGGGGGSARPLSIQPQPVLTVASAGPSSPTPFAPPTRTHGALALSQNIDPAPSAAHVPAHATDPDFAPPTFAAPTPLRAEPPKAKPVSAAPPPLPPPTFVSKPVSAFPQPAPPMPKLPVPSAIADAPPPSAQRSGSLAAPSAPVAPPLEVPPFFPRWRTIVENVRKTRAALAPILEHGVVTTFEPGHIAIAYETSSITGHQAAEAQAIALVEAEATAHLGVPTKVTIDSTLKHTQGLVTLAALDVERRQAAAAKARLDVEQHPLVQHTVALFGAEIREVKLPPSED